MLEQAWRPDHFDSLNSDDAIITTCLDHLAEENGRAEDLAYDARVVLPQFAVGRSSVRRIGSRICDSFSDHQFYSLG